jgi:hypothetical protein
MSDPEFRSVACAGSGIAIFAVAAEEERKVYNPTANTTVNSACGASEATLFIQAV